MTGDGGSVGAGAGAIVGIEVSVKGGTQDLVMLPKHSAGPQQLEALLEQSPHKATQLPCEPLGSQIVSQFVRSYPFGKQCL